MKYAAIVLSVLLSSCATTDSVWRMNHHNECMYMYNADGEKIEVSFNAYLKLQK